MQNRFLFMGMFVLLLGLFSCQRQSGSFVPEKGVSKKLNDMRKHNLTRVTYDLHFVIPEKKSQSITGKLKLSFSRKNTTKPLVIDFQNPSSYIKKVRVNEKKAVYQWQNGHIVIPSAALKQSANKVSIDFIAGDQALNRNDDFLYTLFVPDRASTAFPCFDQPDLKAIFHLSLSIPSKWVAVANGKVLSEIQENKVNKIEFKSTKPISTYLFSFVAGKFKMASKVIDGRILHMYYRETDTAKVNRNVDDVFKLEAHAIAWMENYTDIPYPFGKFDFVLIPAFQYSGMEHPGAVLYRASRVLLDPSATQTQKLFRASLIAHETAHMWFGDLVTMKWFDDVWLKEVFANFMAAKISRPAFPGINHSLRFLIDHYPKAYAVDRTEGANSIKQTLPNLKMAGMLYGAIIYHKAPIVMMKLEDMLGKDKMREGLRIYLERYSYSNADWDDLIAILDKKTTADLKSWSQVWVKEAGMPHYNITEKDNHFILQQSDPQQKGRIWPQQFHYLVWSGNTSNTGLVFNQQSLQLLLLSHPDSLLFLNADGKAYGFIKMSPEMKRFIRSPRFWKLTAIQRAAAYISIWENMQNEVLSPVAVLSLFKTALNHEKVEQNLGLLLAYYPKLFWRFTKDENRPKLAVQMESLLWGKMLATPTPSLKAAFYHAWLITALSKNAMKKMLSLWQGRMQIKGLPLSENNRVKLSYELAVRIGIKGSDIIPKNILAQQLKQTQNPDTKNEIAFVAPALNEDVDVRTAFFERLKNPVMREHEPWVITALSYLHHPLRAHSAEQFILPSLEMLPEIQQTGDIFFPKSWLDATFYGHHSLASTQIINEFIKKDHNINSKLRQKILQSVDPVIRAAKILYKKHPDKNL